MNDVEMKNGFLAINLANKTRKLLHPTEEPSSM
jgi:hypothetical protein